MLMMFFASATAWAQTPGSEVPASRNSPPPVSVAPQINPNLPPVLAKPTNPVAMPAVLVTPVTRFSAATKPSVIGTVRTNRVTYGGTAVQVSKRPQPKDMLQLINPFTPAEYGYPTNASFFWKPYNDARSWPRAFRDEKDHEPRGFTLITVGF
jgi:hypothetical protein